MTNSDTKRQALREKVEQSQAELAKSDPVNPGVPRRDPPEGVAALVMDYPFVLMIGGLAAGAVIGALLPKGAARKLTRGAVAAAAAAGELGRTYSRNTLDKASDTASSVSRGRRRAIDGLSERLADLTDSVSENAHTAGKRASTVATDAAEGARDAGLRFAQQVLKLTSHLRH
ncbi:MAG: hypothetical protein V4579_08490 [Pseudomonadota bacterium]